MQIQQRIALICAIILVLILGAIITPFLMYALSASPEDEAVELVPDQEGTPSEGSLKSMDTPLLNPMKPRITMFYTSGHAPTEQQEYKPVPFESLLPKSKEYNHYSVAGK